ALHYTRFVLAIAAIGIALGFVFGYVLGHYETRMYAEFYHFPFLLYEPGPRGFVIVGLVTVGAALAGGLGTVRRAVRLAPAEAMRPPAPPTFRHTRVGPVSLFRQLEQPTRIILRQIFRYPVRAFLTSTGIGLSVAVLVTSLQWLDAIDHMLDVYFLQAQGQDVTVSFVEPRSSEVTRDLARLPGVLAPEPSRFASAKLRFGHRVERQ